VVGGSRGERFDPGKMGGWQVHVRPRRVHDGARIPSGVGCTQSQKGVSYDTFFSRALFTVDQYDLFLVRIIR
jgi:hypothetical protein